MDYFFWKWKNLSVEPSHTHLINGESITKMINTAFDKSLHLSWHQCVNTAKENGRASTIFWFHWHQFLPIIYHHIVYQVGTARQPVVYQNLEIQADTKHTQRERERNVSKSNAYIMKNLKTDEIAFGYGLSFNEAHRTHNHIYYSHWNGIEKNSKPKIIMTRA